MTKYRITKDGHGAYYVWRKWGFWWRLDKRIVAGSLVPAKYYDEQSAWNHVNAKKSFELADKKPHEVVGESDD